MKEYRKELTESKDERRSKAPDKAVNGLSRKKHKPIIVQCKANENSGSFTKRYFKDWRRWNRYAGINQARTAIKSQSREGRSGLDFRIDPNCLKDKQCQTNS